MVARDCHITFTQDPDGRATMGGSSGGAAAFTMAWFHPELYRRVLTYSGTYKNNQSPKNPAYPSTVPGSSIMNTSLLNIRRSLSASGWKSERMTTVRPTPTKCITPSSPTSGVAAALKGERRITTNVVYALWAGNHVDEKVVAQTLPQALE